MTAMTMTEQILARAAHRDAVSPGENIWVDVDVLMTHDVCGPGTIGIFKKHFGPNAKVWDRRQSRHHPRSLHLHCGCHGTTAMWTCCGNLLRNNS
jgi:homoaconitase/3-isopropylmalate dehydratase large subunit